MWKTADNRLRVFNHNVGEIAQLHGVINHVLHRLFGPSILQVSCEASDQPEEKSTKKTHACQIRFRSGRKVTDIVTSTTIHNFVMRREISHKAKFRRLAYPSCVSGSLLRCMSNYRFDLQTSGFAGALSASRIAETCARSRGV